MSFLSEIFSWWGGNTWGTRFTIWRQGRSVGEDLLGNRYFEQVRGFSPHDGPRRWVVYARMSEPTQVPPEWHGWLHHTQEEPPVPGEIKRPWEKPHLMNMTGTSQAYRPPGSILKPGKRPPATGDYEAWQPDEPGERAGDRRG